MKRMTKTEYRSKIEALGLSQGAAASLMQIGKRTSRRYALGESEIPDLIARFLRLIKAQGLTPAQVIELTEEP